MRKGIEIKILQKPVEVVFNCAYCDKEIEVEYEEFEIITSSDLMDIFYENPSFKCPKCNEELYVAEVELD